MPEQQHPTLRQALDPVYDAFASGGGIRGVLTTPDDVHWVAVTCDRLELAWPYSEEPATAFVEDMGRYLPGLALETCEPGRRLLLNLELPKLKVLLGVVDQIFARVYKCCVQQITVSSNEQWRLHFSRRR